jgi:hypothetical protein
MLPKTLFFLFIKSFGIICSAFAVCLKTSFSASVSSSFMLLFIGLYVISIDAFSFGYLIVSQLFLSLTTVAVFETLKR